MFSTFMKKVFVGCVVIGLTLTLSAETGQAVPSFARQTGLSCTACHTVWPQLTPFGRIFKLDGYTLSVESPSERLVSPDSGFIPSVIYIA